MEPVDQYEKVLGVLRAFTGHEPSKVRVQLIQKCSQVLETHEVWMTTDASFDTRRLGWGPTDQTGHSVVLQNNVVDIDWIVNHNMQKIRGMQARNHDRQVIIKSIDQPEMVAIDQMLKQYTELTYKLGEAMKFGTKLFWDKPAIQSAYGLGWSIPQNYPF
jgi:hypothetical protein